MSTEERTASGVLGRIVRAAIHPAIGVARVGNSPDGFFIGPEVVEPPPVMVGDSRDDAGALKRQAARFRIYGYDAAGEVVAELTAASADIVWTVHLANRKAAWYQFQMALDIPEAQAAPPSDLRNATVCDRASLVIDPGPRSIAGAGMSGPAFDSGAFQGNPVYLGELRTDPEGRLVVLGGRGVSASTTGATAKDFANNDGWHDDVSDGPVTAAVSVGGCAVPVEPAWVVVAPPNYAPNLKSVRTMYDLQTDVFVGAGWLPAPGRVSFTVDILPILRRMSELQWVNRRFAAAFGWRAPTDLQDPASLADASPDRAARRKLIADMFRVFDRDGPSPVPWPWLYGDAMATPPGRTGRQHSVLSHGQMCALARWAEGDFEADYDPCFVPPHRIEQVPLAAQPAMLDRAALEFCVADAFHPGSEMTWPMRHATIYAAPFRIRHRAPGNAEAVYGATLTAAAVLQPDGPLNAQGPGGLTRWLAVPWQTDTASCRSGYDSHYDLYVPTFWPARVPNDILTADDYASAADPDLPAAARIAAFNRRCDWIRPLGPAHMETLQEYIEQINAFVGKFGGMGVVEARTSPGSDLAFPSLVQVETPPTLPVPVPRDVGREGSARYPAGLAATSKAHRLPGGPPKP
jgi:hypothetical protein